MIPASFIAPAHSARAAAFLTFLGALALAGIVTILLPFAGPIVLATALSITAYPVYCGLGRRWPRFSSSFRALVTDLGILILFVLPVVVLVWTAAGQADTLRPVIGRWIQASQAIHQGRLSG